MNCITEAFGSFDCARSDPDPHVYIGSGSLTLKDTGTGSLTRKDTGTGSLTIVTRVQQFYVYMVFYISMFLYIYISSIFQTEDFNYML